MSILNGYIPVLQIKAVMNWFSKFEGKRIQFHQQKGSSFFYFLFDLEFDIPQAGSIMTQYEDVFSI